MELTDNKCIKCKIGVGTMLKMKESILLTPCEECQKGAE